jgi:hypothetical protein
LYFSISFKFSDWTNLSVSSFDFAGSFSDEGLEESIVDISTKCWSEDFEFTEFVALILPLSFIRSLVALSDDFERAASYAVAKLSCSTYFKRASSFAVFSALGFAKSMANPCALSLLDLAFAKKFEFT